MVSANHASSNSALEDKILSEVHFIKRILPFVTQFQPALLMDKWHLIQNQPTLRQVLKEPPLISYRKGESFKDMLVNAKLQYNTIVYSHFHSYITLQCFLYLEREKRN